MQSSCLVWTAIFCISKELWSSVRVQAHSVLMHLRSCPHTSWQLSPILFNCISVQMQHLFSLQEARTPLLVLSVHGSHMHLIGVWAEDTVSRGRALIRVSHTLLDDSESEEAWSLMLSELLATVSSSESTITLVGLEGSSRLLPQLYKKARSCLWCQFRWVFITLDRVVLTFNLNFLEADMGPLFSMTIEQATGGVVPLCLGGASSELRKWALQKGSALKGDVWQQRY